MVGRKAISFKQSNVPEDVARVLNTLLANLPSDTTRVEKLESSATLDDVIVKLNQLIDKVNNNTRSDKISNLTNF